MKARDTAERTRARDRLITDLVRGFWLGLEPRVFLESDGTARAALVREVPLRLSRSMLAGTDCSADEIWQMVRSALAAQPSVKLSVAVVRATADGVQVRQGKADMACAEVEVAVDAKGHGTLQGKGLLRLQGCPRMLPWGGATEVSHDLILDVMAAPGPPRRNRSRIRQCRAAIANSDFMNAPGPLVLDGREREMRVQPVKLPFVLDDETVGGADIWYLWRGLDHSLAVEPLILACTLLVVEDPGEPEEVDVVSCLASVQGASIGLARLGPSIGPNGVLFGPDTRIHGMRFRA